MGMKIITEFVSDLSGDPIEGNSSFTLRAVDNSNPDGERVVFDISSDEWEELFGTLQSHRTEKKIGRKKGSETASEETPSEGNGDDAPASSQETPSEEETTEETTEPSEEETTEEETPSAPTRGRKTTPVNA